MRACLRAGSNPRLERLAAPAFFNRSAPQTHVEMDPQPSPSSPASPASPVSRGAPGARRATHVPVLLREVLQALELTPGLTVVDGTLGAGGHSLQILQRLGPSGRLISLDRDQGMIDLARPRLAAPNAELVHASYAQLPEVLARLGIDRVDRILLDLGWCSDQLAAADRGFSFQTDAPLDLRYDTSTATPAWQLLASASEEQLVDWFESFGEDRLARQHARRIVAHRQQHPLQTTFDLVTALTGQPGPWTARGPDSRHPATQVFQALRIAVNRELDHLAQALDGVSDSCLKQHGILAVISFHSLEDRMVKQSFRDPTRWQPLLSKPVSASPAEQRLNPRSRTAQLRAARKISPDLSPLPPPTDLPPVP